jgi:hypothetical protein
VYLQRQLGHASIALIVNTFGKLLPKGDKAAVDALDEVPELPTDDRMVTLGGGNPGAATQMWKLLLGRRRIELRTR